MVAEPCALSRIPHSSRPSLVGRAMVPGAEEMVNEQWVPPAAAPGTPQRETTGLGVGGGVGQYDQAEQVPNDSPTTRGPSARVTSDESPVLSSASESCSTTSRFVTRRDFQRVKRRLIEMSEHLRDSLKATKLEIWEAIDDEVKERKQESPLFQRLLNDRTEIISQVVRTSRPRKLGWSPR